jgi:formylglycine-generating enzyme required for sulfatase activity
MLPDKYQWITAQFEPEGDPWLLDAVARELADAGNLAGAASVWDRAFGIAPEVEEVRQRRWEALGRLAVVEHGIRFRYVPAGPFVMGSDDGEDDERPRHPVWLGAFWLSEAPVSWAAYCRLMDWGPPPFGVPRDWLEVVGGNTRFRRALAGGADQQRFHLWEANKLRLQYCEDRTTRARDWHSHFPNPQGPPGHPPPRDDPDSPWAYEDKPMVAVAWQEAQELADRLSTEDVRYGLPSEAQWEKAARGGLIGTRHPWGDAPPSPDNCDCDGFRRFCVQPSRRFPPNSYGLYAMSGGVWEWTADWYDSAWYGRSPSAAPAGPPQGEEKVLRGGSWSDCADVVTVSFRMSRGSRSWREANWGAHLTPTVGFRLCRVAAEGGP